MAISRLTRGARARLALLLIPVLVFTIVATMHRPTTAGSGFPVIKQISQDLMRNTDSQHATEVEPASLAWGNTIVSIFQEGRFYSSGGGSAMGFATSTDGGLRWHYGFLPKITRYQKVAGKYDRGSDPAVAYDAKHAVWLAATLPIYASGGNRPAMLISRSTDGLKWQTPVEVPPNLGDSDKTWVACDDWTASPHYGNCYAEWDSTQNGMINLSVSSDGGMTWGPARNSGDSVVGQGGLPQIQPNGHVIVPFWDYTVPAIGAFQSTDGGNSWSSTTVAAPVVYHVIDGGMRALELPGASMDGSGKVFVVWMDCSFRPNCTSNDIVMISSTDGTHWSAPAPIPIDPSNAHLDRFIPGFAIDPATSGSSAHLALTFYYFSNVGCFFGNCQLNAGFVDSHDGGATWSTPLQLAGPMHLSWLPNTTLGPMVGDYVTTSFVNGKAFGILASADAPFFQTFEEAMFTITGGAAYSPRGVNRTPFGMRPVTIRSNHPEYFHPAPLD